MLYSRGFWRQLAVLRASAQLCPMAEEVTGTALACAAGGGGRPPLGLRFLTPLVRGDLHPPRSAKRAMTTRLVHIHIAEMV